MTEKNHSRGYLPHVVKPGATYFVTFRLADSLPQEALREMEREIAPSMKESAQGEGLTGREREKEKERRKRIELYLDRGAGRCWLRDERIAAFAAEAVQHFNNERYVLGDWIVMPNHVHVLLRPIGDWTLSRLLQGMKGTIAREANRILRMTGMPFWQQESFDRIIRDEDEMAKVQRYIRRNPVKAGLCEKEEDWRWGSAWNGPR